MKNMTFTEIIADEAYNDGYKAGIKSAEKKYKKLFELSINWLHIYESSFGTPDENECPQYWELKNCLFVGRG